MAVREAAVGETAGVDDVGYIAAADRGEDLVAAVADLGALLGADAVLAQELGRAVGRLDVEAEVVEAADERQCLLLILIGDGGQHRAVIHDVHARGLQRLVERAGEGVIVADGLTGRLHFGREVSVKAAQLREREGGRLDVPALLLLGGVQLGDALLAQRLAENGQRCDVGQRPAGRLREEGHRAGRARVDLNDVNVLLRVNDKLNVEQAHDADAKTQTAGVVEDLVLDGLRDAEGGIDTDRVARVDAGALDVLHDAGNEDVGAVADGVDLDLLARDIAVDQNRAVLVDLDRRLEVAAQCGLVGDDLHRAAAEDVARAHQHRIADAGSGGDAVLDVGYRTAHRLRDLQLLHDLLEGVAVFGALDGGTVGADQLDAALLERLSQVDGRLPAQRGDDTDRLLEADDVHDVLDGQRLEVELVRGGVVGGDRLGVVVDDDGLIAVFADGGDSVDGRIVELDALADADRPGAEHDDFRPVAGGRLVLVLIGRVEVRNVALDLGGAGVDHLVDGEEVLTAADGPDLVLRHAPQTGDILVREAHLFGGGKDSDIPRCARDDLLEVDDVLDLVEEEHVDLGRVADQAEVGAEADQLGDGVDAVVGAVDDVFQQLLLRHAVKFGHVAVADADLQRADGLEQALLDGAADAHDLAGGLHLGGQLVRGVGELVKREARHLGDDIVDGRLEGGRGVGQLDLVEVHADGNLGGDAGDRVARRLRCEGRGARHAWVDLNEVVVEGLGVKRKLDVAAALDLQRADDLERAVAEHVVFVVGQGLRGGDDDRVTGVDADRVDVLHRADGDGGVVGVAHNLELDLLVALDALLDQHLMHRREGKAVLHQIAQLLFVVGEAAACAAERKGGTQDDRVADLVGGRDALFDRVRDAGGGDRLAQRLAELLEALTVLGAVDAFKLGAQQLDLALAENALLRELHGQVQTGLAADAGNDGVGTLVAKDLRHIFERQRLHVDLVGDGGVGHDGGGVGVDEDDLVALFLEGKAGLRACVVELSGLADDNRAGADNEDFVQIGTLRHVLLPPS